MHLYSQFLGEERYIGISLSLDSKDILGMLFFVRVVICPMAIAYSYGTDNKISLCLSVRLSLCVGVSVCRHSHGRISLSIFTKLDTEV